MSNCLSHDENKMGSAILKFRRAIPTDLPLISQMMRAGKAYWGYPKEGLDRFMENFGIENSAYFDTAFGFIAENSDGVVGYYLLKIDEQPPMLDHFFLNTQFIGQGYGRLLWNHCIQQCRRKDWKIITFWSDPHSLKFYEHMGATKINECPMVTLPGQMAPIMQFVIS